MFILCKMYGKWNTNKLSGISITNLKKLIKINKPILNILFQILIKFGAAFYFLKQIVRHKNVYFVDIADYVVTIINYKNIFSYTINSYIQ